MRRTIRMIALSMLGAALTLGAVAITPVPARSADPGAITLYTDPATGQVYTRRCKHCVRLGEYVPAGSTEEIERKVEQRVSQQTQQQLEQERAAMKADEAARQAQQQQWNAEMAKQVSEMRPAWQEFGDRWFKKISIGTLVFANYGFFTHTGFGPQFQDSMVWPGVGNDDFNEFSITRSYLNFIFTPTDDFTMRVTPDMYAMINTGTTCTTTVSKGSKGETVSCTASSGDKVGNNSGWAQTDDGNMGLRLKYAYLDYNTFFQKVAQIAALHDDRITFGAQQNPLIDWEEALWGFRYTSIVPWNYAGLSSTQLGIAMKGPVKFHETQYADYDFGVYDDANFHQIEQSSYKQFMGRVTINPLGAQSRTDSLGITYFYNYGYPNKAEDTQQGPSSLTKSITAPDAHIMRMSVLTHYNANPDNFWGWGWGLIGEWDYGNNAFSTSNLLSGSGPSDAVGIASTGGAFTGWYKMANAILSTGQTHQMGWDVLGHVDIKGTPFTLFGLWQNFQPNNQGQIRINPLNFYRYDLGLQYMVNKYLRIALDYQGIDFYRRQFTFPETVAGSTTIPKTPFAVPRNTNAFFLNMEFRY